MSPVTAIAVVVDRAHSDVVGPTFDQLGGAWAESFRLWQRTEMGYVVMVAHTRKRLLRAAPLVYMAKDASALRDALLSACVQMSGNRYIQWAWLMVEGSEGIGVARAVALADSDTWGRA